MPTMPGQIYVSHAGDDEAICAPLLDLLDSWHVDYWFDRQQGGGRQLSARAQKALSECHVLLRVCTRAANRSYSMSLDAGAFLSMQADDHRAGRDGVRSVVNLILDPEYRREPFDGTAPVLDASDLATFAWVNGLRAALGLPLLVDAEAAALSRRTVVVRRGISRRRALALGATGALVVAAGASAGVLALTHGHGSASARPTPRPGPPSSDPKLLWYARVVQPTTPSANEDGVGVAPVLTGVTVFTGALDGSLFAVDASTGAVRWQKVIGNGFYTAPVVGNGTLFVCADGSNGFRALNPETGDQLWQANGDTHTFTNVAFVYGRLFISGIGDLFGFVFTVDPATGKQLFSEGPRGSVVPVSEMGISGTLVYLCGDDGYLYAFDCGTNNSPPLWRADVGASNGQRLQQKPLYVSGAPTVANGVVYVGSEDQSVYAIDASTGERRWRYATTGQIVRSSPTVVEGTLYIGSDDKNLYAIDAATGNTKWVYQTTGKVRSTPAVANGVVYVGSADNFVHAVSAQKGALVHKYPMAGAVIASAPRGKRRPLCRRPRGVSLCLQCELRPW